MVLTKDNQGAVLKEKGERFCDKQKQEMFTRWTELCIVPSQCKSCIADTSYAVIEH